jgi:acetamidase/formamidase
LAGDHSKGELLHGSNPGSHLVYRQYERARAERTRKEGAEPGDTLAVKLLDLQVDGNQGVGALGPGFGALNETDYTPMLHPPLPEKIWFYPIDHANNTATFKALDSNFSVKIPLHPFFGCIGVAPADEEAAAPLFQPSSAATWIRPRPTWATQFIFP